MRKQTKQISKWAIMRFMRSVSKHTTTMEKNLSFNRRNKYGTHSYSGGKMHMHTSTTYLLGIHYHSYGIYLFISLKLLPS